MKIYLLNPPFKHKIVRTGRWQGVRGRAGGFSYPMWLSYATGVLETRYENVRLVDAIANKWNKEETLEDVVNFKPDMLVVDTNFSSTTKDMEVASFIKKNIEEKDVITVMVGPPTVPFVDKILNKLDIVARYEYDYTLLDIADTINACIKGNKIDKFELYEKLRNVKGISYRYHNDRNLETIHNPVRPFLASDELDKIPFVSKVYKKHLNIYAYNLTKVPYPMVQIFTGRGCPALCTFCAWPQIFTGRMYRPRSVENTLNELEYIKNEMPEIKGIFFEDDTFALDKKRIGDIADEIKKRKLKIEWSCYARANLDYIILKKMKEAGCILFTVGYESGSETILKNIKKGISLETSRKFTRDVKKAGIMIHSDFIFGLPGETKETIKETIKYIKEIKPDLLQIAVPAPLPGTEFYNFVKDNGYLIVDIENSLDEEGFQKCTVSYPWLTSDEIIKAIDDTYKQYYINPLYAPIAIKKILKGGLPELKIFLISVKGFLKYIARKTGKQKQHPNENE